MSHATISASEATFTRLFNALRDNFVFEQADSANFGRFTAGYDIKFHLEGGTIDLRADNTVQVKELDIKWDRLNLSLAFDIPEICIGGFCIIPNPFGGCLVRAPRLCAFSGGPEIRVTLPLGGFTSELSVTGSLLFKQFVHPNRPPGMDDWTAREANPSLANLWQLFVDPQFIDIDPIDVADTVGDMLERAVDDVINNLLGFLPGWARDIIRAILGPVIDLIRKLLDIADDIQEWVSDLLNVSFGLLDLIGQFIADYFAAKTPLFALENPYPIMDKANNPNTTSGQPPLIPVLLPIRNMSVSNDNVEMTLEATIG
jgi:hypothetical protein